MGEEKESLLHKFRVEPVEGFPQGARLYLDDKRILAKGYTLEHYAGGLAHLTLEMDVRADAEYDNIELFIQKSAKEISHLNAEIDGVVYDTEFSEVICTLKPTGKFEADNVTRVLMRTETGEYFSCQAKDKIVPDERRENFTHYTAFFNIIPITLDDAGDYIMEFYPEEYDRVKPILDAEREKSAKNKKG